MIQIISYKLEKKINISLTKVEYEYLKEMCKSMYGLQKYLLTEWKIYGTIKYVI